MDRIEKLKEFLLASPKDNFLRHALALEYLKVGQDNDAKLLFETILTESPDYIGSYYHLAKLLERTGEFDKAITIYKKGMEQAKRAGDGHTYNELQGALEDIED